MRPKHLTWSELASLTARTRWRGAASELQNARAAEELAAELGAERRVSSVRQRDVDALLRRMAERGLAPATVRRKLNVLGAMLERARLEGIPLEPIELRRPKRASGRQRILAEDEEGPLFSALEAAGPKGAEAAAIARALLALGCRYSELARSPKGPGALGRDFVERDGRWWVTFSATKNGGRRTLPVPRPIEGLLRSYVRGPDVPLFEMPYRTFHWYWKRAVEAAGLDGEVVTHTLRHTCITRLLRARVPLAHVKEWAGHRDISTTLGYTHLTGMDLLEAADALG